MRCVFDPRILLGACNVLLFSLALRSFYFDKTLANDINY